LRLKQAGEEYEEEEEEEEEKEDLSKFLPMPPSGSPVAQRQLPIDDSYEDTRDYHTIYSSSGNNSISSDTNAQSSASADNRDDYYGDNSYNPGQNRRPTPSSRNVLNSNIMKLEEQVNRLSKLTKGINTFINFSNPVEVEKLNNSSKKIVNSSRDLKEYLNDINLINKMFESKMKSIINKIEVEYTKINSALNGYTYTFLENGNFHNNHIFLILCILQRNDYIKMYFIYYIIIK
jgi:hypothetical protein